MTDREAWISVFNSVFRSALTFEGPVRIEGKPVSAYDYSKLIADQTLKDAPEDHP